MVAFAVAPSRSVWCNAEYRPAVSSRPRCVTVRRDSRRLHGPVKFGSAMTRHANTSGSLDTASHRLLPVCANGRRETDSPSSLTDAQAAKKQRNDDNTVIAAGVAILMATTAFALTAGRDSVEDVIYGSSMMGAFGAGDVVGALLWSFSLWFCSPWQLLLLFLGAIETERPSDWLILQYGKLTGQQIEAVEYSAPLSLKVAAAITCIATGCAISAALELGLGDATWAVSTGIGSIMVSGIYEAGRPTRLNAEEAEELQQQWSDFASFADQQLLRTGRCHETEICTAFRKSFAQYRDPETVPDRVLRDMIRQWFPAVQRTSTGYYKNVSIVPKVDPFQ